VHHLSVKSVTRSFDAIAFYYDCGFQMLGEIEMLIELQPSAPGTWRSEIELFGFAFKC
jgi:hypothetical protein